MYVMQNVVSVLKELLKKKNNIRALETGTIRSYDEKHESTRYISKTLSDHGTLISVDINKKSIAISKDICKNSKNVEWVLMNSIEYLSKHVSGKFDFVLLDSVNIADHIWKEYKLILPRMNPGGVIIVDDAGVSKAGGSDKTPAKKGRRIWEELTNKGQKVKVLDSPHGTQLRIDF